MTVGQHRLYSTWNCMRQRCSNPKQKSYKNYGGRGIKVCPSWDENFYNFVADMGDSFQEGLTLDRIDNDKGYSKENCRWASRETQRLNSRPRHDLIMLEAFGILMPLIDWAKALEIDLRTLHNRVIRKWDPEKIVTTGVKRTSLTFCDCIHSIKEWSIILGIPEYTISNRIRLGWDTEKILTTPFKALKRNPHKCGKVS